MTQEKSVCSVCGAEFDSEHGLNVHKSYGHEEAYKDEERLRELYIEEGNSAPDIAEMFDTGQATINKWLHQYGIEVRSGWEARKRNMLKKPPTVCSNRRGYEYIADGHAGDKKQVYLHRIIAVSEYGADAVAGNSVHHKNGIPWDNRPANLEVMPQSKHLIEHLRKLSWLDQLRIMELYRNGDVSITDLGEMFGVDASHISRVKNGKVGAMSEAKPEDVNNG